MCGDNWFLQSDCHVVTRYILSGITLITTNDSRALLRLWWISEPTKANCNYYNRGYSLARRTIRLLLDEI